MTRLNADFVRGALGLTADERIRAEWTADAVTTDSRGDVGGRLFVALRGPRHDGHDHLADVAARGAAAAIVSDVTRVPAGLPVLVVDDTRLALGRLASRWRDELRGPVIGVTGSVGKTTVKEMLRSILEADAPGRVTAAPASWNNDVGLPMTLLSARPGDRAVVCEIGTGGPGEIAALGAIARPDVVILTALGHAHIEAFGSLEAIAHEKASLVAAARPEARIHVNGDSPLLAAAADAVRDGRPVTRVGTSASCDIRVDVSTPDRFELRGPGSSGDSFSRALPGDHHALNAAVAIVATRGLGVPDGAITRGLGTVELPGSRMARVEIGGVHVHDDAWNASPESMIAAVRAFDEETADVAGGGGRRVLVLGDMMELGERSASLHRAFGARLAELDLVRPFAHLVLVGSHARAIGNAGPFAGRVTEITSLDDDGARAALLEVIEPGDHVLLKGSRGGRLERVRAWLASEPRQGSNVHGGTKCSTTS